MPNDASAADRRVMKTIGDEQPLPVFNLAEGDLYVLAGFPIAALLLGSIIGIDLLTIPLLCLGITAGVAVVFAAPTHLPAATWLRDLYRYYCTRPRRTFHAPATAAAETAATESNAGGLVNYTPFAPDERTQDLTNIHRAWPGAGAIQREDGSMEAMLQVDPGNMDFAMSGDWARLQSAARSFANDDVQGRLTLYTTTESFPTEQLVERIDEQLDDEQTDNPVFEGLLEEYRDRRPTELEGTQQIQYYIGVEVAPYDVYERYQDERSPVERLTEFPVVGIIATPFVTRREQLTDAELRAAMLEKLDERLRTIQTELIDGAPDWSARRLSTVELFGLAIDFWNGTDSSDGDPAAVLREHNIVRRSPREGTDA